MSMIDAYRIGVELVMGGDLAAGIEALIPGLTRMDELIVHSNAEAKGLASSLKGIGASASGINKTADALNRMHEALRNVNQATAAHQQGGGMPGFLPPGAPGPGAMPMSSGSGAGPSVLPGPRITQQPYVPNFITLSNGALVPYQAPHDYSPRGMAPFYQPNFTMPPPGSTPHDATFAEEGEGRMRLNPAGRPAAGARGAGGGSHVEGALDGVIPALLTGEFLKSLFHASFDVAAKEAELLTNGWTPGQMARARDLAQSVQVSTPGATIGGGLEIVKDLGSLFRKADGTPDTETAMAALPQYAKDALVLGRHGGNGINELFNAARAGELKGELSIPGTDRTDPAKFSAFVHQAVLAEIVSGGRVTPQMMLQNLKTGGVASAMMDDKDFFGANLALIEGLGSQAASAMSGFNRQFGAGRMGKGVAKELEGVFPHLAGHWHSVGMGQVMVDPGAMGDPEQLARHPFEFIRQTLMPGIDKIIRERTPGFDAMDADHKLALESQEGSRIAASVTGSKAIVEVMRLWPQMARWQLASQNAQKSDPYAIQLQNNPEIRVKALSAAWNAFEVSLGEAASGPAIAGLNAVTGWLNEMARWAKENPDGSKAALEGLALGIGLFGLTTAAGAAMKLMTGPMGFIALAGGIEVLGGAFKSIPQVLIDMAAGAAAGGRLAGLPGAIIGGIAAPAARDAVTGWGNLLQDFKQQDWNPTHGQFWLGRPLDSAYPGGSVHLQSYHPDPAKSAPTIHLTVYSQLDGRQVAKSVTQHQIKMMGGQVNGTLRPDPSISPQYGAHLVET